MNQFIKIDNIIRENEKKFAEGKSHRIDPSYWQTDIMPNLLDNSTGFNYNNLYKYNFDDELLHEISIYVDFLRSEAFIDDSQKVFLTSGSTSALLSLHILNNKNNNRIFLCTPNYYASKFQLSYINAEVKHISIVDNFGQIIDLDTTIVKNGDCISLSLPIFGYGSWPDIKWLTKLIKLTTVGVSIVLDEANSFLFPNPIDSILDEIEVDLKYLFRIRSISKPFFLHGIRLSAIICDRAVSSELKVILDTINGGISSLDIHTFKRIFTEYSISDISKMIKRNHNALSASYKCLTTHYDNIYDDWIDGPITGLHFEGIDENSTIFFQKYIETRNKGVIFRPGYRILRSSSVPSYGRISLHQDIEKLKYAISIINNEFYN